MARVVVVGGGLGGLATAARLARLGHQVTVLERRGRLGGAVGVVERGGFRWDAGPAATALPAVLRDLFRKSGRTLDRELALEPVEPFREHRFLDGARVALPSASRAAQVAAVDTGLGAGGRVWVDYLRGFAEPWELLRRDLLERPATVAPAVPTRRLLRARRSLHRAAGRAFADVRLRRMATYHAVTTGQDPREVPAWLGLVDYLELTFGVWTAAGGFAEVAKALGERLRVRGVTVRLDTRATGLVTGSEGPRAVVTDRGELAADLVVWAADPRALPAAGARLRTEPPAPAPAVTHLGLDGPVPDLPAEVVLHGDRATTVVRSGGTAPHGGAAWTVLRWGAAQRDPLTELAGWGLDVAGSVVVREDRSPGAPDAPYGPRWRRGDPSRRLSTRSGLPGVYVAGAHPALLGLVPFVGLTAAVVADLVGPAERSVAVRRSR